ncbi:type II toxin-antitoxin system death-on-curing family toxin [Methylocella sp.]|uniref:type II toxin-antitoxin system death-on-curing family toxin n=1 Tax=Methylocella sp. TaxID=1978226 RepID=UPI003C1B840D
MTTVLAIHEEQIAEHGGAGGVRDRGLLSSALDRPRNIAAYEPDDCDLPRLAAAYGCGIAKNHPFSDGDEQAALVVAETFLNLNGLELTTDDAACVAIMRAVADGTIGEEKFAGWIRENVELLKPPPKPRRGPRAG